MAPSSNIQSVLTSLTALSEAVRAAGTNTGACGLLLSRWAATSGSGGLVLCPDDDSVNELVNRIECLSKAVLGQDVKAIAVPTWDQSAYSPIAPSIRTRLARVSALTAAAGPGAQKIWWVTTPAALCQATIPVKLFRSKLFSLKIGASVESREALIRRLIDSGYQRVDPVEDPGTFAVRGDIVDVFPPEQDQPLRIELFGDEIERLRYFDPATQRAGAEVGTEFVLAPAREVLITAENVSSLRERLKTSADDAEIPRALRDPVLAGVSEGVYSEHSDTWAPFAYDQPETLLDHLPANLAVAWFDELGSRQRWDEFLPEQRSLSDDAPRSGVVAPAVEALYRWTAGFEKRLLGSCRLYLDRLEVANVSSVEEELKAQEPDPTSTRHRFSLNTNSDLLAHGPRKALDDLEPRFQLWRKQGFAVLITATTESQAERIKFLLQEHGIASHLEGIPTSSTVTISRSALNEGLRWPAEGLIIITDQELLGSRGPNKTARKGSKSGDSAAKEWSGLQALADLALGDAVVHIDHGIGRYQGLVRLDNSGAPADFLQLEYAGKDKLYLPVYRLNVLQKYVGAGETTPLDRLGAQQFAKAKEKVRDAVKRLAIDLVKLYAERSIREGVVFGPRDSAYREFEAQFPFDETPDQIKAIEQTLDDLESGRVMDRLICGDVGYGKTEVAIRAAFRAASEGKQVVVLVPTTILAHQHEQSFKNRLQGYPIIVDSVSRFKNAKEQKKILGDLASGKVDIIIGTHRLLSKDVAFKDLGLVIVDEEHRFGVEHKEKLKALKVNTHVLTLTATPIPRTLHMSLSGLRDITLINTPPVDRLPIRTYVSKQDDALIERAIRFELGRGGQVFYLHNRVQTIAESTKRLRELVPEARIGIAHGQMSETELEAAMLAFYQKETNILVCTTIIESGIDVPTANTLIVTRADALGLAQLYQIRGRVGRGQSRAYAYLLIPAEGAISEDAKKRLEVLQRFVELGSGFSIASHDLEIRGGGDLLGPQQSGHIAAVGFDLYTQLLDEAVQELHAEARGGKQTSERSKEPEIKVPFPAFLPEEYVPDVHQRLSTYRRLSGASDEAALSALEAEMQDRFGEPPEPAKNLFWLIRIKQWLQLMGIDSLTAGKERVSLHSSSQNSRLNPIRAIALVASRPGDYQLLPDSKFVAKIPTVSLKELYFGLEQLGKRLA